MSNTTSINLGDHFTAFLSNLTESGRYGSTSEAIREALRLLEQREAENGKKLEALDRALIEGEESGESDLTHAQIIAEAKAELHAQ